MDEAVFPFLIVGGSLLIMALFIVLAVLGQRKRVHAWEEFAVQLGLSFEPGGFLRQPAISGSYRSHAVRLDTFTRGSGQHSTTYTRIVLSLANPSGMQMELGGENVFSKIGKALGGQDIETGDAELDGRYVIKGQPESAVLRVLMQINLRQRLIEARWLHVKLNGDTLRYERRGIESNPETLKLLFDLLADLADGVERI
jgi:hypothetical protein